VPEFFCGRAEFSFECGQADRDWFWFRREVQNFDSSSETVTKKVPTKGDAGSRFDRRKNAGHAVMFLHDPRFLFHLRKRDREIIIIFRIIFVGEADQRFGRDLANRDGAASGKRMLRGNRHTNAFVKQLFISQAAQRTSLRGTNDQSDLKPAIAYAVENGLVAPIVQSDVHVWHFSLKCP